MSAAPNWTLEVKKIKELRPHPKNPRRLTSDQGAHLSESLKKFGLAEKPIINLDGMIIGGHQRINLLKKNKITTVECWVPSRMLTEEECDEMCIRLNKNSGEWNFDDLANSWEVTDLMQWGFDAEEFLGTAVDSDEGKEKKEKAKKQSECPNCGHCF